MEGGGCVYRGGIRGSGGKSWEVDRYCPRIAAIVHDFVSGMALGVPECVLQALSRNVGWVIPKQHHGNRYNPLIGQILVLS